jgi:RHS repeat-associated protein
MNARKMSVSRARAGIGSVVVFVIFLTVSRSSFGQVGNDNPTGTSGQFNGNITTGCSFDPYTANATRSVTDIIVAGGVGSYPLAFTRTMNSRYTTGVGNAPAFGTAGTWTFNYQWTIDPVTVSSGRPTNYSVNYPDGRRIIFRNTGTSDPDYRGPLGVRDRFEQLTSGATECYLRLPDGGKVWFHASTSSVSGGTQYTFTLKGIIDPYGQTTTVTYPSDGSLTITEPAGRYIKVFTRSFNGDLVVNYILGSDGRRVDYTYGTFPIVGGPTYTCLTGVHYFSDSTWDATYTYQAGNIDPKGRPLIQTCIDPMFDGPMWEIAYDFKPAGTNADGSAVVYGQIWREKHPNGTAVSTLTINAKASNGYNSRTETRGDNPTGAGNPSRVFTYNTYKLKTTTDFKGAVGSQNYDNNWYLQSVTDRNNHTTQFSCDSISGNTHAVTYPSTAADTGSSTPTTIQYNYGAGSTNNPYYLQSIQNGLLYLNTYTRDSVTKQITRVDYPDSNFERFSYNQFGQKLTHTLRDGSIETWNYDSLGRVTAYWDAVHPTTGNPTTRYQYDSFGRIWKTTEGRGNGTDPGDPNFTTSLEYNLRGQLTKTIHPDNTYIQSTYNSNGTLASTADELGHTISYTYDDYKRQRTVTTPLRSPGDSMPRTTVTCYDQGAQCNEDYARTDNKPTKVSSPGGKIILTSYDDNLRPIAVTSVGDSNVPNGVTRYAYDPVGNRTTVTDPNGNITVTYYDKQNRIKFIDDPMVNDSVTPHKNGDGHTTLYFYDGGGNKIGEERVDSLFRYYFYDNMGRLSSKSGWSAKGVPPVDLATYTYDKLGNIKEITVPGGSTYDYTYDALKRKLTAKYPSDAAGIRRTESWHYDIGNYLDNYTNPAAQVQTLQYDRRGRLINTFWSTNGPTVATSYDAASRPSSILTSDGALTAYQYDDANNKVWEDQSLSSQPLGPLLPSVVSRKTHGLAGDFDINLPLAGSPGIECRNGGPNGNYQLVFTFPNYVTMTGGASVTSGAGAVSGTTVTGPVIGVSLTGVTNSQFITVTLTNISDGTNSGNVSVTMGVLLGDTNADGFVDSADIAQTQSQSGHAVTSSNFREDATVDGFIDSADIAFVQSKSGSALPPISSTAHRVRTDPDADGNRRDLVVSTNGAVHSIVNYDYTSRNQLLNIRDSGNSPLFTYSYDATGNLTQRLGHRINDTTVMHYDPLNRATLAAQSGLNGASFSTEHYEYTARGDLRDAYREEEQNKGDSYSYDNRDQLTGALYSASGVSGTNPNPQNPASTVSYDCNVFGRKGMTVTDSSGTTNVTYNSDNLNQYTSVTTNGSNSGVQYDNKFNLTGYNGWIYTYDALNRLTSATLPGMTSHSAAFTYDGTGRCVRRVIDGTSSTFAFDGWKPVAEWNDNGNLVATNLYGPGPDEILYRWSPTNELYYKMDPMGNVRFLLNTSGSVVEQYIYDAFGGATIRGGNGNLLIGSSVGNRFMAKGREYFEVLGLYDYRKRIYHPALGRFLQVDPIGFAGDPLNLYRFVNHNPLTNSDPMGEDFGFDDPFAFGFFAGIAGFTDAGALDAPIADVNDIADPAGETPGDTSSTSPAQVGNMGQDATDLPNEAGVSTQSGTKGDTANDSQKNSTGSTSAQNTYRVLATEYPDGQTVYEFTKLKNDAQVKLYRATFGGGDNIKIGTGVPILVPPGEDPQATIDAWGNGGPFISLEAGKAGRYINEGAFYYVFRPGGPNDFKAINPLYDAYGNFLFGASGAALGVSESDLQFAGNALHAVTYGRSNFSQNVQDIHSGFNAIGVGGVTIVVPINSP